MSMPKKGLGRGLSALIPSATEPKADSRADSAPLEVSVDRITPSPFQPRRSFDEAKIAELAFARSERDFPRAGLPALMTVLRNHDRWDKSNADYREGRVVEYNKHQPRPEMGYIDYGLSILTPAALSRYPAGEAVDLADVYHALSIAGLLAGHEVFERFYEIGSHQGLAETEDYFKRHARP